MDDIAFFEQQFGEIGPVLTSDSRLVRLFRSRDAWQMI